MGGCKIRQELDIIIVSKIRGTKINKTKEKVGPTCEDILQHTREGILSPRTPPGNVPPVEFSPNKQEEETFHLLLRHHLTQVDCGSGGAGDPSEDLKR